MGLEYYLTRFRKTLLLVGGSGELGSAITKKFSTTRLKKWRVINIDSKPNPLATLNIEVDLKKENPFHSENLVEIRRQMDEWNKIKGVEEIDAMINLAGLPKD